MARGRTSLRGRLRLIRVRGFSNGVLTFTPHDNPTTVETLPLNANYHALAATIPRDRLCRATVLNGTIVDLALSPIRREPL